jgi:hypothetical protein
MNLKYFLSLSFVLSASLSAAVTVTVTSPAAGSTVASPVHFAASGTTPNTMTGWVVYADGNNMYQVDSPTLDAWVILPFGTHSMIVRGWDSTGAFGSSTFTLTASGTVIPTPPTGATVVSNIDDDTSTPTYHSGWGNCGTPACSGSHDTNETLSFLQNQPSPVKSPSTDSAQLIITGGAFDDGLWWHKLGPGLDHDRNYLWDFWFYIPSDSTHIQATEFDFFQYHAGKDSTGAAQLQRLMYGTQCDYAASPSPVWDSWNDVLQKWIPAVQNNDNGANPNPTGTPLGCSKWTTNTWHHLQYFVQRQYDGSLLYGNVTVDGTTTQWNIKAPYKVSTTCSLTDPNCPVTGTQYQLDINGVANSTLREFLDLITVTAW